jgi:hypothetical protein
MIQKNILEDAIKKYYLNGLTESVKLKIKNNVASIIFASVNQDVIGQVLFPIELDNAELGIYNTSQLIKLLAILNGEINIKYHLVFDTVEKLLINDEQYKLSFSLADPSVIPKAPKAIDVEYDIKYNINPNFILKFIECKKALGTNMNLFSLETTNRQTLKFILGDYANKFSNKIEFEVECEVMPAIGYALEFSSDIMKEILTSNKYMDSGTIEINSGGLMKISFTEKGIHSEYFLLTRTE